jgi:hypothetical protein
MEPPPRPRISRPPESRSSDSAIFATTGGGRSGVASTRVATRIREVVAAIQVSSVHGSSDGLLPCRWSLVPTKSNPSSSAALAAPIGSAPGTAADEMPNPNSNVPMPQD